MADRRPHVRADNMAPEQPDCGVVGDRNDIVGGAEQWFFFLIDPMREIGMTKQRYRHGLGGGGRGIRAIGGGRRERAVNGAGANKAGDCHDRYRQQVAAAQRGKDRRDDDHGKRNDEAGQAVEHHLPPRTKRGAGARPFAGVNACAANVPNRDVGGRQRCFAFPCVLIELCADNGKERYSD